jgi:hypothetical protein
MDMNHPQLAPHEMTLDQRRDEIAAILARGYLRLKSRKGTQTVADLSAVNRAEDLEALPDKSVYAPMKRSIE